MGARRKAREIALQALYLSDITKLPAEKTFTDLSKTVNLDAPSLKFSKRLAIETEKNISTLDKHINTYTANWEMKRMAALDRNILRLGAYEIVYELDTPISVIIDEAVELAKTYSTDESGKFVNGILDKIKSERTPNESQNKSKT